MKIIVHVKPGAKNNAVERQGTHQYKVSVKTKPGKGEANTAVIRLLGEYLKVSRSKLTLIRGRRFRHKITAVGI